MSIPKKYKHIDFKPPASVAEVAARAIEWRQKAKGKGGLSNQQAKEQGVGSGLQRAVNLKNRTQMSPDTVKRMRNFFNRHEKNKDVPSGKSPWEDKGRVAWDLWGGDPGRAWANKIVKQMEAADRKAKAALGLIGSLIKLADNINDEEIKSNLESIIDNEINELE